MALEVRDMKLDELEQMAEDTMKQAGVLLLDISDMTDDSDLGDDEVSASDGTSSEASTSMLTQDMVDTGTYRSDAPFEGSDAARLPPFDPHMHAATVKSKKKSWKQSSHRRDAGNQSRRNRKVETREGGLSFADNTTATHSIGRGPARQKRRRGKQRSKSEIQEIDGTSAPDSDQSLFDANSMSFEANDNAPSATRANELPSRGTNTGMSGRQAETGIQFSNERRSNREPIANRMQAFLDANSSNVDGFNGSLDASNDRVNDITRPRRQSHRVQSSGPVQARRNPRTNAFQARQNQTSASGSRKAAGLNDRARSPSFGPDYSFEDQEEEEATNVPMNLATDMLYRRLVVREEVIPPSFHLSSRRLSVPLSVSCETLLADYPEKADDCIPLFEGIVNHFKAETPTVRSEAVEVFRTILQLLQCHGNMTLQAISLTDSRYLQLHIRFLVFTLNLLASKVGSALVPQDGNIYGLFGRENSNLFVEMIVIQMINVIYAEVQPSRWHSWTVLLTPLRDALARVVPLVETVSRCIMQKFQSNIVSHLSGSVSFRCFKAAIPRREIETIWFLFAFCADAPATDCDVSSDDRWRLIASLFFSDAGVLSKDALDVVGNDAVNLPPSEEHIKSCQSEIGRLRTLVTTATLNPLPSADGILNKLVQGCLHLQAQGYIHSTESVNRGTLCGLDEMDRARLSRMWSLTHLLLKLDTRAALDADTFMGTVERDVFGEHINDVRVSGLMTGTLSMSALSGWCASLFWAWVRQAPKKKARLCRLMNSMNELVSDCINKASELEQAYVRGTGEVLNTNSTFEEAFAPTVSNNGARCAATAYREAAARLSVTWAYASSIELMLSEGLRNKVWEILADLEMKERQRCIVAHNAASGNLYGGDLFRLFSTAKTLAWLTGLHCGVTLGGTTTEPTHRTPISGLDDDRRMFVFLTSCFISCLDCACDQFEPRDTHLDHRCEEAIAQVASFSGLFSYVSFWLSQTYVRCRLFLKISPSGSDKRLLKLKRAAQELQTCVLGMLASPLKRCLVCLTNAMVHGENGDSALRSVLSLIRAVVGLMSDSVEDGRVELMAAETVAELPVPSAEEPPEEDFFGSIDDALFLSIDVDMSQDQCRANQSVDPDVHAFRNIWNVLMDMIKLTKPSDRYAVLPPIMSMSSRSACMTVQGRTKAASNAGAICACLAALTSLQKQDFELVDSSLDLLMDPLRRRGWNDQDDPDQSYLRQVVQCFYSELCCLSADYEQCDRLVRKRRDDIVEHFVEAMLDSNTLERFPSINLKRIKANGGARSERKESLRLTLANSMVQSDDCELDSINDAGARLRKGEARDCPGPAYNSSHLWSFSRSLGKSISRMGDCPSIDGVTGQDAGFMEVDSDLSTRPPDMIPLVSLEKECLKRIALFRGILSYSVNNSRAEEALCFESLSSLIISSCSYQLLSISEGVRYHVRASREDGTMSYKHARLLELQTCYTELTVTLLSWILREVPSPISETFAKTLRHVKEKILSEVLLKQNCNIHSALRQLYTFATTRLAQNDIAADRSAAEADTTGLLDDMFSAVVRRSRQIVLHLASEQHATRNVYFLLNSLLSVGTSCSESTVLDSGQGDYAAQSIARSMECYSREATAVSYLWMDRSRFQEALDEYMRHVELSKGLGNEELRSIQQLRHVAMKQFLVPKLIKDDISLSKKQGILCLLSHLLQSEASSMASWQELLDMHVIVDITKGLASCLRFALESHTVDDAIIWKAFQCARHVLNLPSPVNDDSSCDSKDDTVLSWSRHYKDDSDEIRPPYALYLWTFATWMNNVGKMLVGETEEEKRRFVQFRFEFTSLTGRGRSIWSGDNSLDDDVLIASSRLIELEGKVFAEKENARLVTNVYAKPKVKLTPASATSTNAHEWHPSSSVSRAAKELMAEVIAVL